MRNTASSGSNQERFASAPSVDIQRSTFDRSFNHRTTLDEGKLIPFLVDEILPGDTVELNTTIVCRMATPKFPCMSLLWLQTHYFFVPNRILWNNWKRFQGELLDTDSDPSIHLIPYIDSPAGGWSIHTLADYMGIPPGVELQGAVNGISALPFRAYNRIWNDFYRDQDLVSRPITTTTDGPDDPADYPMRYRAKKADYFTTARPWPLKGGTEVLLPMAGTAPVSGFGASNQTWSTGGKTAYQTDESAGVTYAQYKETAAFIYIMEEDPLNTGFPNIRAELQDATSTSINDLRLAITMQQALELDARSGTRYVEALRARWKVTSPDFRLQRAEYIGGGRQAINVSQVANTAAVEGSGGNNVGDLGGFAYSVGNQHRASFTATEHGVLMGIVSIIGENEYQEGIHKMWRRKTRWDFFEPVFANLGEQAIGKGELYADGTATDHETWAFQERWSEYRYKPSLISGLFRSAAVGSLDTWHTAEELGSLPPLAEDFIQTSSDSPNVGRVVITSTDEHFLFDSATALRHTRAMPVYSVPGLRRL